MTKWNNLLYLIFLAAGPVFGLVVPAGKDALPPASKEAQCQGVHIIVARESLAPPGEGVSRRLSDRIKAKIPNSHSVAVDYPATIIPYITSVKIGVEAMTKMISEYVSECPEGKIVLLGYSQGAHVVGDVLCGATAEGFEPSPPIDRALGAKVIAAISMGDPSHVANLPYNVGTSRRDGLFPRLRNEECSVYDSVRQSYCDTGDFYCDRGTRHSVHLLYIERYLNDALKFVVSRYKETLTKEKET
ncbi:hypothetical protein FQN57_006168 [Myotisia sp. PD_48]|nr:hypothetical protein FQN57_006168 [Myotisia sp. PD_48]